MSSDRATRVAADFHTRYYQAADRTWRNTRWMGIDVRKCPLDLWVYQEILSETRPELIVETGTYRGGSALYLAHLCDVLGVGRVLTIDVESTPDSPRHSRVSYITGSSIDPLVYGRVAEEARDQRTMVILDSDHSHAHVARELALYADLVTPGCYLIVEDTNLSGQPLAFGIDPGPLAAVEDFLTQNSDFEVDATREKHLLTFNPGGYLRRKQPVSASVERSIIDDAEHVGG